MLSICARTAVRVVFFLHFVQDFVCIQDAMNYFFFEKRIALLLLSREMGGNVFFSFLACQNRVLEAFYLRVGGGKHCKVISVS